MFKVLDDENPQIVNKISRIKKASNELRQRSFFHIPSVNTVSSGTEKIQFLGLKIWGLIPNDIKYLENLKDFKTAIKKWKQRHIYVESAKCVSMVLNFYSTYLLKEFSILFSLEWICGPTASKMEHFCQ